MLKTNSSKAELRRTVMKSTSQLTAVKAKGIVLYCTRAMGVEMATVSRYSQLIDDLVINQAVGCHCSPVG